MSVSVIQPKPFLLFMKCLVSRNQGVIEHGFNGTALLSGISSSISELKDASDITEKNAGTSSLEPEEMAEANLSTRDLSCKDCTFLNEFGSETCAMCLCVL